MKDFTAPHLIAILLAIILGVAGAEAGQTLQEFRGTPEAPAIELEDLDGNAVTLSQFRGQVVIVNFWATWCPPCRKEMPSMQRAWAELQANDVMMLAVHVGGKPDQVWEFAGEYDLEFPILMDASSKVSRSWPMRGLPTTFVIGPEGRIVYMALGGREWDDPELLQLVYGLKQ